LGGTPVFALKMSPFLCFGVPGACQRLILNINHTSNLPAPQNRFCSKSREICDGKTKKHHYRTGGIHRPHTSPAAASDRAWPRNGASGAWHPA